MPSTRLTPRFAVLAFVALASTAAAAPPKPKPAEELSYTAPAGWERTEQERIVVFTPPNVPPSRCALIVTPGEKLDGDFLQWFKAKWDALRKGGKVVQGGERTGSEGPNGTSVLVQAGLLESPAEGGAKQRTGLLLYAVNVGSSVHWVLFKTSGPELFNQHKKTVNRFLAGMKFVETEKGSVGRPKGIGPEKQRPAPQKRDD
jgi:hypothetical protein